MNCILCHRSDGMVRCSVCRRLHCDHCNYWHACRYPTLAEREYNAPDQFAVDHHGTSGTWRRYCEVATLADALKTARRLKSNGYGVRIVSGAEIIANAPWQEPLPDSLREISAHCFALVGTC